MNIIIGKYQKEEFENKISKIRKKVTVTIHSVREYIVTETHKGIPYQKKMLDYNIDFPEIYKIDGYEYLGGMKNNNGSNIFFGDNETLCNEVNDSLVYRCHHCGKKTANRVSKFFFRKTDTDEIVHFGSTCVKDYFGIDVYNAISVVSRFVNDLSDDEGDFVEYNGTRMHRGMYHHNMMSYLITYFSMGNPYVSKRKAEESDMVSTSSLILDYMFGKEGRNEWRKLIENYDLDYSDINQIREDIYRYMTERQEESNFDYNLKKSFLDFSDNMGLLTYGVFEYYNTFQRKIEDIIRKNKTAHLEYYNGDMIENERVKIVSFGTCNTMYGISNIVNFENKQYKFTWFTRVNIDSLEEGNEYKIKKAQIKSRKEWNGIKSHVIKITTLKNLIEV